MQKDKRNRIVGFLGGSLSVLVAYVIVAFVISNFSWQASAQYEVVFAIKGDFMFNDTLPGKGKEFVIFFLRKIDSRPKNFGITHEKRAFYVLGVDKKDIIREQLTADFVAEGPDNTEIVVFRHSKSCKIRSLFAASKNIQIIGGQDPYIYSKEEMEVEATRQLLEFLGSPTFPPEQIL